MQHVPIENLRHQPHPFMGVELPAVRRDDARAFLPAVLEGVEAVIGQFRGVGMAVNAEDAAIVFWVVIHQPVLLEVNALPVQWHSTTGHVAPPLRNSKQPRRP